MGAQQGRRSQEGRDHRLFLELLTIVTELLVMELGSEFTLCSTDYSVSVS